MQSDKEMLEVKRLLMLLLVKLGATSDELAVALQVDASAVRRSFPIKSIRKLVDTGVDK